MSEASRRPLNVLFLCTGNSARSVMAEVILNKLAAQKFRAYSAGSKPKGELHPQALALLQKLGYETAGLRSKSWAEFASPDAPHFDFIFTVCDDAAGEECPLWPGKPITAHWGIPDPAAAQGSPAQIALAFDEAFRMLSRRLYDLCRAAIQQARSTCIANQAARDRRHAGRDCHGQGLMSPALSRRAVAEGLGSFFLLATIIGSGIMAERLAGGNSALALLGNTIPTGAILVVLILIFGSVSGAHFNPAVSLAFALRRALPWPLVPIYIFSQVAGGVLGVWAAHAMFELPLWQVATTTRAGPAQFFAEFVATFGLLLTIFGCVARAPAATAYAVGLYITAAYWFTASTSFANPAVTLARALSDTFAGIAPGGVLPFILAQLLGALIATAAGALAVAAGLS